MPLFRFLIYTGLLVWGSPVQGDTLILPRPDQRGELMSVDGYQIQPSEFSDGTRVAIFIYSASWCPNCQILAQRLKEIYPGFREQYPGIDFVTFALDDSITGRAGYLRKSAPSWPVLSPSALDKSLWDFSRPKEIPQLQAFEIQADQLRAITEPGSADEVIRVAISWINKSTVK